MAEYNERVLRIGLPKGSLNSEDPNRGNTNELLLRAGYDIVGYNPGREQPSVLSIKNDPELKLKLIRPQSAPYHALPRRKLDIAIIGGDWVVDAQSLKKPIQVIGELGYGNVSVVVTVPQNFPFDSLTDFFNSRRGNSNPAICHTEYVNLTSDYIRKNKGYQSLFGLLAPLIVMRGHNIGKNSFVQVHFSDGLTESFLEEEDEFIVDNLHTGNTLKGYGGRPLEAIIESSAVVCAGPSCVDWKKDKSAEFFERLGKARR